MTSVDAQGDTSDAEIREVVDLVSRLERLNERILETKVLADVDRVLAENESPKDADIALVNNTYGACVEERSPKSKTSAAALYNATESAQEHIRTKNSFETLKRAITLSRRFSKMAEHLHGVQDGEEKEFIKNLIEEQSDLSSALIDLFDRSVTTEADLIMSKSELARQFAVSSKLYPNLSTYRADDEEPSRSDPKIEKQLENRAKKLKAEEDNLMQMKFLVQKLIASCDGMAMNFENEAWNKEHEEMLIKCGQDLPALRGDK